MKESAQAALTYARSKGKAYRINPNTLNNKEIHIHVPAGAIPKDGPSAGITMAVSIFSALTSLPVKKDVMGQMLIEAPPGEHDLRLVFEPPFENFIGRIVTVLALAACLALFAAAARQREVPA